jgi:hypothetical protein
MDGRRPSPYVERVMTQADKPIAEDKRIAAGLPEAKPAA